MRRDQLVEMRKAERVRLKTVRDEVVIDSLTAIVALLNDQIKVLEQRIGRTVEIHDDLARDAAVLHQVPGVGPVAASVLLAALPELGRLGRRAVAALAELAPIARDSGLICGRRCAQVGESASATPSTWQPPSPSRSPMSDAQFKAETGMTRAEMRAELARRLYRLRDHIESKRRDGDARGAFAEGQTMPDPEATDPAVPKVAPF